MGGEEEIIKKLDEVAKAVREEALMRFPSSKYWSWKPLVRYKEVLKPGKTEKIYEGSDVGWIYYARLVSTSPDLKIYINFKADYFIEIEETIRSLKKSGYGASQLGFRVLIYDDFTPLYGVEYAPGVGGFPGVPFRERNLLYLTNESSTDAYYWFTGWLILVEKGVS